MKLLTTTTLALTLAGGMAMAAGHAMPMVEASNQDVSNGVVSAEKVMAGENGWLVVHRTDAEMKPGPVVGYAPLRAGENTDVAAILQEEVNSGEMLMLMVHAEQGGMKTGVFEYTLGAKEDGPIKPDGKLVMTVVTAE
ncbi:hypothetical protein Z945_778 [Sulfitobacter noctilucae]|uniref:DUF7282 domain-containing protein n=1 Tax=Sulfitobacter noctilucae TaxID=1342302 RepID=UPI00046AB87C|nr:hypothetical protein [Sulfitobacter noctilucae]KIN65731.1 hypothetical protein Z945_778 [Sulfitobacter noctilucae]